MKPKTLSSTLATPYDTYFQVQVTMNSETPTNYSDQHFCPMFGIYSAS